MSRLLPWCALLLLILPVVGCSDTQHVASPFIPDVPAIGESVYTVESGDTLAAIAARFEVPLPDLIAMNGIADPSRIEVGQELIVSEVRADPVEEVVVPLEPTSRDRRDLSVGASQLRLGATTAGLILGAAAMYLFLRILLRVGVPSLAGQARRFSPVRLPIPRRLSASTSVLTPVADPRMTSQPDEPDATGSSMMGSESSAGWSGPWEDVGRTNRLSVAYDSLQDFVGTMWRAMLGVARELGALVWRFGSDLASLLAAGLRAAGHLLVRATVAPRRARKRASFRAEIERHGALHYRVGLQDDARDYLLVALEESERREWADEAELCRRWLAQIAADTGPGLLAPSSVDGGSPTDPPELDQLSPVDLEDVDIVPAVRLGQRSGRRRGAATLHPQDDQ